MCVRLCGGGYVFTCLSPLAHDSVGSLGRQGRFCVHSIFNLFVPLNRDTCLLTKRRVMPMAPRLAKVLHAPSGAADVTEQRIFEGSGGSSHRRRTPFSELKVYNFQLN